MTAIAVLGATSHIAGDFIRTASGAGYDLFLFSRRPQHVSAWLASGPAANSNSVSAGYDSFAFHDYDAIINFVGAGDPARTISMGSSILDVTQEFDALATSYLSKCPETRYVFLSSGAVYGGRFLEPVDQDTVAEFPVNHVSAKDYYSVAKLYAEIRHRALAPLPIIDIRIFNYFSRTVDVAARFFMTDVLRAICDRQELETGSTTIHRDYLVPADFFSLIDCVLRAPAANVALDAYSRAPTEKFALLDAMQREFGLHYRISAVSQNVNATGVKLNYYSTSRKAEAFGYQPRFTSLEGILAESRAILGR